jgi:hypothetical protein
VFLSDLEDYFKNLAGCALEIIKEILEANLHMFIEILVLLYADDTVIFSESKEGMQSALNVFQSYKFSLCGTPAIQEKQFDCLSLYRSQDLILSYIL